jgi:DNA-nicking Smr family endonuclease
MGKKKKQGNAGASEEAPLPKFGGFQPLAAGLGGFKAKLDAEAKKKEADAEAARAAGAAGKKVPPPAPAPRRPEPIAKRTAASDKEDELTFHRMMSGVTPLTEKSARVPMTAESRSGRAKVNPEELRKQAQVEATSVLEHLHSLVDDVARFEVSDDGKRVEGRRVDAPPNLVRELRRGMLPIDARLDLHGLTAVDARERLADFLKEKRGRGERCVLVIHGKGEGTAGSIGGAGGVLRGEIAAWLAQGRAKDCVAAFATAREEDGGEGAVYVALRR